MESSLRGLPLPTGVADAAVDPFFARDRVVGRSGAMGRKSGKLRFCDEVPLAVAMARPSSLCDPRE